MALSRTLFQFEVKEKKNDELSSRFIADDRAALNHKCQPTFNIKIDFVTKNGSKFCDLVNNNLKPLKVIFHVFHLQIYKFV